MQRGLSIDEIEGMSQARLTDFLYLLDRLNKMRQHRLREQEKK
jgi:hypothetical protein